MPLKPNLTIFPSIDLAISLNSSPGISEMKFKLLGTPSKVKWFSSFPSGIIICLGLLDQPRGGFKDSNCLKVHSLHS